MISILNIDHHSGFHCTVYPMKTELTSGCKQQHSLHPCLMLTIII